MLRRFFLHFHIAETKMRVALCLGLFFLAVVSAFPQKEGGSYTNEAIRQAQNSRLIPKDAQIQKVVEGIEIGAYESIPGNQRVNLFEILGDQVPPEVVNNLQQQVDQLLAVVLLEVLLEVLK